MKVNGVDGYGEVQDIAKVIYDAIEYYKQLQEPGWEFEVKDLERVVYGRKVEYTVRIRFGNPIEDVYVYNVVWDKNEEFAERAKEKHMIWKRLLNDMLMIGIAKSEEDMKNLVRP